MNSISMLPASRRYLLIDPSTQTVSEQFAPLTFENLCATIGCDELEAMMHSAGHLIWFDASRVPENTLLDVFVVHGMPVAGSRAVMTGGENQYGTLDGCRFSAGTLASEISWRPARQIVGETVRQIVDADGVIQLAAEWLFHPPL